MKLMSGYGQTDERPLRNFKMMLTSASGKNKFSKNRFQFFKYRTHYELFLMIALDRIKILTNKKYIDLMDSNVSTIVIQNNVPKEIRYNQRKPYQLYINASEVEEKCIIEFSSKVLLDRYPELINRNNIHTCFENINALGICDLNVMGIVNESELLSVDITSDIGGIEIPDKLAMNTCLRYWNKFHVQKYLNSGNTVTKEVKTKNRQIRFSFYDKYKELNKACNRDFLDELDDKYSLLAYYNGKFRMEANIKTTSQIKDLFQVGSNNLMDVLNSSANPLLAWFDEAFEIPDHLEQKKSLRTGKQSLLSYEKLSELKNALLLQACENDIEQVQLILRNYLSPKTNIRNYRRTFRRLISEQSIPNKNIQIMRDIREKLTTINNDLHMGSENEDQNQQPS